MDSEPRVSRVPWGAIIGITVLAIVGFIMLGYSVISLLGASPAATAAPTRLQPTQVALIPTTTPAPTLEPTAAPTGTPGVAATEPPTTANAPVVQITVGANVRTGPGLNYPVVGGLDAGAAAPVLGRDSTAQWFVVKFSGTTSGQAWVSTLVSTYAGDINSLPIVAAPPPPAASNTPVQPANTPVPAASNTPSVLNSRGIVSEHFSIENTTVGVGQDIWFRFKVVNTTDQAVPYGALAAHTDVGPTAQSWTDSSLAARGVLEWRDHLNISTPGTYQVYLGICYAARNACLSGQAPWERLSHYITVIVQ